MPPDHAPLSTAVSGRISVDLQDWQGDEYRADGAPASISLAVQVLPEALRISAPDGREVVLELQNGALRVLSYSEAVSDGPVVVEIPAVGDVTADTQAFHEARHDMRASDDADPAP